jgi:fibro-slime domain-containing protein
MRATPTPPPRRIRSTVLIAVAAAGCGRLEFADRGGPCNVLPVVYRDFDLDQPDFDMTTYGLDPGIVLAALGADRTPVYDPTTAHTTVSSAASFAQWFHDVASVNVEVDNTLPFTPLGDAGLPMFGALEFHPLDGQGLGDSASDASGIPHNFNFTAEIHAQWSGGGAQTITANCDDDCFVFVDGVLGIDRGGIHMAVGGTTTTGGAAGDHTLDVFYADRGPTDSTLELTTTIGCLRSN